MARLLNPPETAKLFLVIRLQCSDGDNRSALAKHITVEDMEKYTNYIEDYKDKKERSKKQNNKKSNNK